MKKSAVKIWSVLLSLIMMFCMLALAACGTTPSEQKPEEKPPEPEHTHTYATEWSKDETNHWHAATCVHTALKSGEAAHDTNGADGACSVCGYATAPHEHTFDMDRWANDETDHWRAATCEHTDEIKDKAAHVYEGVTCSACGYVKDHEHTYNEEYGVGLELHWLKNNCCYPRRYINVEAHNTDGEGGACTVCGFVNAWTYEGCVLCPECGGCLNTVCNEGHKKCGDGLKDNYFEAEDAVLKDGAWPAEIADYTAGPLKNKFLTGVQNSGGVGLIYTITASKECTVTLKVLCGRQSKENHTFSEEMSIFIDDDEITTNVLVAQPYAGTTQRKANFAWITIGCVKLKAGENVIRLTAIGTGGVNTDKISLCAPEDVTFEFTPTDNSERTKASNI